MFLDKDSPLLYTGGFAFTACLSAICISSCLVNEDTIVSKILGSKVMSGIGLRSYAIYIWHWPVFCLTEPRVDSLLSNWWILLVIRIFITGALSEITYRLIDTPIRNNFLERFWNKFSNSGMKLIQRIAIITLAISIVSGISLTIYLRWNISSDISATIASQQKELIEAPTNLSETNSRMQSNLLSPKKGTPDLPSIINSNPIFNRKQIPESEQKEQSVSQNKPMLESEKKPDENISNKKSTSSCNLYKSDFDKSKGYVTRIYPATQKKRRYFAIGDSVMLGAASRLYSLFGDDIHVDAKVSRQLSAAKELITQSKNNGTLGDVVILHLGNNDSIGRSELRIILNMIKDREKIFLVNLKVPRSYEKENNAILQEISQEYSNVEIINWRGNSIGSLSNFASDGIHLTNTGAKLYTQLISNALNK